MRAASLLSVLVLGLFSTLCLPGCGGGNEATVAPRSEEEIEAAEAEIYGAEQEEFEDTQEAEEQ